MKWHRDSQGQWHPERKPPSLRDDLLALLMWLIPGAVVVWTIIMLMERKP